MKTLRVFPRRTKATPDDDNVRIGYPTLFDEADEILVSVTFSWDKLLAEELAEIWYAVGEVKIDGPAYDCKPGDFVPGKFVKTGYVITSRGCPNKCWFCSAWQREGDIRELPITDGWNVLDNNLLACSDDHVKAVFKMLARQKHPVEFTGGLDATLLKEWHIEALMKLKPKQIFFSYDSVEDWPYLVAAVELFKNAGFSFASHALRCFVLIGHPNDTFEMAELRLRDVLSLGFTPMAMLWRGVDENEIDTEWRKFQRLWVRPAIIYSEKGKS